MRILLVTYHFPPDPAVGGIRALRAARTFVSAGHEVQVIAAHYDASLKDVNDGIRVQRVRSAAGIRGLLQRTRRLLRTSSATDSDASSDGERSQEGYSIPRSVALWKRFLFALMWLPDDRHGFIRPACRVARALHASMRFDIVYTSAPPHSIHLVGHRLKKSIGVPWIAEYRDPWTDGPGKPYHVRTRLTDAIERVLENRCLRSADRVVAVTKHASDRLSKRLAALGRRSPAVVIRNGIDRFLGPVAADRSGAVRILYLGDLYLGRDPEPFLRAVSTLCSHGEIDKASVRIDLIGSCRYFHGVSVAQLAEDLRIADLVNIADRVPHEAVHALLEQSDVLLLLAQGQPSQVPNKLYEYLGARRTILAFADAAGESAAMLRQVGSHYLVTESDSTAAIADIVKAAIMHSRDTCSSLADVAREWSAEAEFRKLVSLTEELSC
jgi:hypothetical protein